jgi:hypothetical protein
VSKIRTLNQITISLLLVIVFLAAAYSQQAREIPEKLTLKGSKIVLNSSRFQAAIKSEKSLGDLVSEVSPIGEEALSFGFAAKSEEAKTFIIGILYSEALAFISSGKFDLASKRLDSMRQEFINLNAPGSLYNYISKLSNMVDTKQFSKDILVEFLALFQPFCEDYAAGKSEDHLILFQAGSWIVDMSLTAAAGDTVMLKQPEVLNYFIQEMKRMDAPKGVIDSLDEIAKIAVKKDITERDIKNILKLGKKIQTILG